MEQNLTAAKAAIAAALSALGAFLGWKGIMALCWIAVMALDYLSGSAAACKAGQWNSEEARSGIWHKLGMIFAVIVSAIADGVMVVIMGNIPALGVEWPGLVMPLVLTWYILTELGSILENAVKLGAKVPQWLTKLLKAGMNAVDAAGGDSDTESDGSLR